MNNNLKKEAWQIAKSCLKRIDSRTHGIGHIREVHKHFQFLKNSVKQTKINKEIMESLEFAVILHDIGNRDVRDRHGKRSIKILQKEFPGFYSKLSNREWIKYTIENHSYGAVKNPKTPEQLCLSYLILLDNMDGLGTKGEKRIERCIVKELKKPLKLVPKDNNNSVFEGLLFNHYWIDRNLDRIKANVSKRFKIKYGKLKKENERVIIKLVKEELKNHE